MVKEENSHSPLEDIPVKSRRDRRNQPITPSMAAGIPNKIKKCVSLSEVDKKTGTAVGSAIIPFSCTLINTEGKLSERNLFKGIFVKFV
jgi:hypothetical protein